MADSHHVHEIIDTTTKCFGVNQRYSYTALCLWSIAPNQVAGTPPMQTARLLGLSTAHLHIAQPG